MLIGVLALQGGYQAHASTLSQLNVKHRLVRDPNELASTDGFIIPGGESPVFIHLMQQNDLWTQLSQYKKPILGTCAGAILLAKKVLSPSQAALNRISVTIERNAYGRQLASQVTFGNCLLTRRRMEMIFIRAPKIVAMDKSVKILAEYQGQPVAVQEANCIAATFHPELSYDKYLHRYFIQQVTRYPFNPSQY